MRRRRETQAVDGGGYRFLVGALACVTLFVLLFNLFTQSAVGAMPGMSKKTPSGQVGQLIRSGNKVKMAKVPVEEIYDTAYLRIVDKNHRLESDQFETVAAFKVIPLSSDKIKINGQALKDLRRMLDGAKNENVHNFVITSGYRTTERQRELYNAEPDSGLVAEPLASEHNTGLAVDFATIKASRTEFAGTEQGKWARKHAGKYGFIQSYPEGSEAITGIRPEPWHYRYVGLPHSKIITQKGWTLNEYVEALKYDVLYTYEDSSGAWQVYRTKPQNGKVQIPKEHSTISSDGEGGYVVTCHLQ